MTTILAPSQKILTPHLEIRGGTKLSGEVRVSGAKNSALVLMAASLLTADPLRLRNMPALSDIQGMGEILESLGVTTRSGNGAVELDASGLSQSSPPYELVNGLRASFFCIGPLLARLGVARVPLPRRRHPPWRARAHDRDDRSNNRRHEFGRATRSATATHAVASGVQQVFAGVRCTNRAITIGYGRK